MPDAPARKGSGKGLKRKVAGQPIWAWPLELVAAYLVYRWYVDRQAANAATAALGTTSGPPGTSTATDPTPTASTTTAPQSWQQWLQDALTGFGATSGYSGEQYYNDLTQWINGGCVSSATGANAIFDALQTNGTPPGFGITPAITVCPQASKPPATTTTPTGGGSTPAAPASLWSTITGLVGGLSKQVGRNAPASLVTQWDAAAKKLGLTGQAANQYVEAQNVGYVSEGLHQPTVAAIDTLAHSLAGGTSAFNKLTAAQQGEYQQYANVTLLAQLNPK